MSDKLTESSEIEEVKKRQDEAARRLGMLDSEIDVIRIRTKPEQDKNQVLNVALRIGVLQAKFEPMLIRKQQHGHS